MTADPTTLVLVRHGVTDHTTGRRFSGGLGGSDPALSEEGRDQVRSVGAWLGPLAERVDGFLTSPVRRTRESAAILAETLGREPVEEPGFAEMDFGAWDGLSFEEVREQHGADLEAWIGALDVVPGGSGESLRTVRERVLAARDRCIEEHRGRTVVVVSHVTPIKTMLADAVGVEPTSMYRMELAPASVSIVAHWPVVDGRGPWSSVRLLNALPPDRAWRWDHPRW